MLEADEEELSGFVSDGESSQPEEDFATSLVDEESSHTSENESDVRVQETLCYDDWLSLFDVSIEAESHRGTHHSLEDVTARLQEGANAERVNENSEEPFGSIALTKLPSLSSQHLRLRVDVDSVKGLVAIEALPECFKSEEGQEAVLNGLASHATSIFKVCNAFSKSREHMRGVGHGRRIASHTGMGLASTPRVPQPSCHEQVELQNTEEGAWPFPTLGHQQVKWIPLADIPHVLFGKIGGPRGEELKVWWLFPSCPPSNSSSSHVRCLLQIVAYKAKEKVMHHVGLILQHLRSPESAHTALVDTPQTWDEVTTEAMSIIAEWQTPSMDMCRLSEQVHDSLMSWVLFSKEPDFQQHVAEFNLAHPALDLLCKLIPRLAREGELGLSAEQTLWLTHSMAYVDGKGMKDKINAVSTTSSLHPDTEDLRLEMQKLVPGLKTASGGLCRIDVAYEWTLANDRGRWALLWSLGNQIQLMKSMPKKWVDSCRMYNNLGCADAVDMQAHLHDWVPQPYNPPVHQTDTHVPNASLLRPTRGAAYMGIPIPSQVVASVVEDHSCPRESLWDLGWSLNIYCTGPRRLASSFGTSWALDFPTISPYLLALHEVGESDILRKTFNQKYDMAAACIDNFCTHVEQETPAQHGWSLRAEIGGRSVEDAVAILDHIARTHRIDHHGIHGRNADYDELDAANRPIVLSLHVLGGYLSTYIQRWWSIFQNAATESPVATTSAVLASWAEQTLSSVTFIVRGQHPWSSSAARLFLKGCMIPHRMLLPHTVKNFIENASEGQLQDFYRREVDKNPWNTGTSATFRSVRSLQRIGNEGRVFRHLVQQLGVDGNLSPSDTLLQVAVHLLGVFYADIWNHMVSRRCWSRNSTIPPFLCEGVDTTYSTEVHNVILTGPSYNANARKGSKVHPISGTGSRILLASEVIRRWFPMEGHNNHHEGECIEQSARPSFYYATIVLWNLVRSLLDKRWAKQLTEVMECIFLDGRKVNHARTSTISTGKPLRLLVPDGTGPARPFRTNNQWVVVQGPTMQAFQAPRNAQTRSRTFERVTRQLLKQEWQLSERHGKKGWTQHELDVFSMFILLEGGEERLNHIDAIPAPKITMDHTSAFTDPSKMLLYCFRFRRSVEIVTCKFNDAVKNSERDFGGWSLQQVLRRIEKCLGSAWIGNDGRLNKAAAEKFLVQSRQKTLQEYLGGWVGSRGPTLDSHNKLQWTIYMQKELSHPPARALLPFEYRSNKRTMSDRL